MATKRLIDANALTDKCRQICADEWNKRAAPCSWSDAYEGFIEDIEAAPTVDAVEVVHGRWMHHESDIAYCSNCEVDAVEDATNSAPTAGQEWTVTGMTEYTALQKVWYQYHTGSKGKRKHLELKFACTNCRYVWDKQAYAFRFCPGCGLRVSEIEDAIIEPPKRRKESQ